MSGRNTAQNRAGKQLEEVESEIERWESLLSEPETRWESFSQGRSQTNPAPLIMDLAVAVVVGIVFSSLMFAWNSGSTLTVERTLAADKKSVTYEVGGSLFFASIMPFMEKFSVRDDPDNVHIHFDNCDIYVWSAIEAVNSLAEKYAEEDKKVKFGKISLSSRRIMEKAKQLLKGEVADSFSIINEEEIVPGEANKIGEGFIGGRKPTWAERGGDTTKRRKGGSEADEELGLKEEPKPEPEKKFFGLF